MAIRFCRKSVDQVDNTVFKAANIEAKHHVRNEWTRVMRCAGQSMHVHCVAASFNAASIAPIISVLNLCNAARAFGSSVSVGV